MLPQAVNGSGQWKRKRLMGKQLMDAVKVNGGGRWNHLTNKVDGSGCLKQSTEVVDESGQLKCWSMKLSIDVVLSVLAASDIVPTF